MAEANATCTTGDGASTAGEVFTSSQVQNITVEIPSDLVACVLDGVVAVLSYDAEEFGRLCDARTLDAPWQHARLRIQHGSALVGLLAPEEDALNAFEFEVGLWQADRLRAGVEYSIEGMVDEIHGSRERAKIVGLARMIERLQALALDVAEGMLR